MRTRFLTTDYFSTPSTCEALRDFQVLSLPLPSLSSPDPSLDLETPFLIPDSSVKHEIDRFPFEEALADFLSDVIPRFHGEIERRSSDVSVRMQPAPNCESGSVELRSGANEMECIERTVDFLCEEVEVENNSESKSSTPGAKFPVTVFQFEIPEVLEFSMGESGISSNEDESALFFEIPGVSVPLDKINVDMTISITCPYDVDRLLSLIEDVPDILISNQESFFAKDGNSLHDKFHHAIKIPCFEVGEIHEISSAKQTFSDLLTCLKPLENCDGLVVNAGIFLESSNANILEHFWSAGTSEYFLHEPIPLNSLLELDLIDLNDSIFLIKHSLLSPVISDENSVHLPCSVLLEEVQILDGTSVGVSDMFSHFEEVEKEYLYKQMSKEDIGPMVNFYESVLTSELSLADDVFKYFPAPVMHDDKNVKSQSMIMEDILNALKPHPFSVSDEIYLDWHPLVEGACNHESCSALISTMEEVCCYKLDTPELLLEEDIIPCDFDFVDDSSGELSILQYKEVLTDVHENNPDAMGPPVESAVTKIVMHDLEESDGTKQKPKINPAKISSCLESLSQTNDLNFFLGVRKGSAGVCSAFETSSTKGLSHKITSRDNTQEQSEPTTSSGSNIGKIEIHEVSLSGYTLGFIDKIQGIYFLNLNKCKDLISNSSSPTKKYSELLSIPKGRLLELIAKKGGSQCPFGTRDEAFTALLAIYAIKQMAYYLCIFGFDIAYLYVSNLSSKVDILADILQPFRCLLQEAHQKIEKQLIEPHSSFPLIESILRSNASDGCQKALIISDEVFWASLKQKLTILKIKFHEVSAYFPANQMDIKRFEGSVLEALSHADCLLLAYQNISASFPFNMFSNILEYGGIRATSRISEMLPCLGGFNHVHFIKVCLGNHYLAKALCEGFDASMNPVISMEGYLPHLEGCLNNENTEGLPSQISLDKACNNLCESAQIVEVSNVTECAKSVLHLPSSNKTTAKASVPEVVIIVNTQNIEKNMIISRRRSYQKILALEKGGVQVVERDINLPLDLIFSAAVCLVWYEAKNIEDKTEAVPDYIENIATKILMSLSSSFSCCILIFEGESNFLTSIMESSDMLYAAAASLDLNLQLFCSHMAETTEDIILNCIRTTSITDTGHYSAMPESETIAESFLTKFPSLNPLSAHAILSSGGMLVEFLEWSQECRIQALGKYKIPAESISLFNALCRYGELGEATSVMTDCSSIDSDISGGTLRFKRKRQRHGISSYQPGMLTDDSIYSEPCQSKYTSSGMSHSFHSYHSNNFRFSDVPERIQFLRNSEITEKRQDVNLSKISTLDRNAYIRHSYPHDKVSNDVDYSCSLSDEQCTTIPRSGFNMRESELRSEPISGGFPPTSRVSGYPSTFPTASEINHIEDDWTSFSQNSGLHKETGRPKIKFFNTELSARKNEFLHENQKDALGLLTRENRPYLGEMPRSHERQSSQQQKPQKYTMDFFGRANYKNRMYQSPRNTCLSHPGSSKKKAACQKRSPSIIDRFRYQGGGKEVKESVNKWKRLAIAQPSPEALDKKNSALIIPSWTPIDKRARQLLSFTRTGNQKQSRLVWRRSDSPRVASSFRKRHRDEKSVEVPGFKNRSLEEFWRSLGSSLVPRPPLWTPRRQSQ